MLGGSLAVLTVLLTPPLFTALSDAFSVSQSRRLAGFLPIAFAVVGGCIVVSRLKALGVEILWIMPIQPIGVKNRKGSLGSPYSIRDYRAVNPEFGTMAEFKAFVRAAHAQGIGASGMTFLDTDVIRVLARVEGLGAKVEYLTERVDTLAKTVATTAAEAWAGGAGVCQDYAHCMLALARLCGLSARYVSGHLLGEGGTHAWVEVLVPHPQQPEYVSAVPFDPTHNRRAGLRYVTVAVGRDYADVAPTSGTYEGPYDGVLTTSKRAAVTSIEYLRPQRRQSGRPARSGVSI